MNLIDFPRPGDRARIFGCVQPKPRLTAKLLMVMKLSVILLTASLCAAASDGLTQAITFSAKNASVEQVIAEVERQTPYVFVYYKELLTNTPKVSVTASNMPVHDFLTTVFRDQPFTWSIQSQTIVLKKRMPAVAVSAPIREDEPSPLLTVTGKVTDAEGNPLPGATVAVRGGQQATATDQQGRFKLHIEGEKARVVITSVGFAPITFLVQGKTLTVEPQKEAAQVKTEDNVRSTASMDPNGFISVKLVRLVREQDEVVITGLVNRRKESFTGSAATYSQKELREVGGTNILQSLKTLDPAFAIRDNVQFGSDPNRLPDLEIRGKTSLLGTRDQLSIDPNQPLFILDGFESSLSAINDLDINRVESITILKDAASTAIYGSKAANGVVVVETVKPKAGKLRVSYTGNIKTTAPDLSSYNLMDAAEKLEFERLSGRFDSRSENPGNVVFYAPLEAELGQMYNDRVRMLEEGINTYWLAEPLRVGLSHRHSLYVAGGEGNFLFGLGGGYNGIKGVMKGSERNVLNGNIDLSYRTSKFQFSNKLSVQRARFQNPIVPFSEFAQTNPYYKKTNNGVVEQWLENSSRAQVGNPIYNASLNSRDGGQNTLVNNFFTSEWRPTSRWLVRGRFGLTFNNDNTETFYAPEDTRQMLREFTRRGQFATTNTSGNRYQLDLMATYARVINKHRINVAGGGDINSNISLLQGYMVEGFPGGNYTSPNFSRGHPLNSRPTYSEALSRSLNGYLTGSYAFDDRYLVDLSGRANGSSVFGSNRRFSHTWSVGLGWNLHREKFFSSSMGWINTLRIRGSIGNPGNQNFSSSQTLETYQFLSGMTSYFGLASVPSRLGNPDLEWEITRDHNIGMDLTAMDNRFSLNADYYYKVTSPQLITIEMPLSSGSNTFLTSGGGQVNQGLNFSTSYQILRNTQRRILWRMRVTGRTLQKARIFGIGDKLDRFNNEGKGSRTTRYIDGADPNDIWAVRSMGIDPSTGKELFLTKDGVITYDFSYDHEVRVGNSRPDMEGIVGSNFTFRGFALNFNFRYQFGAEKFNAALQSKVENVNMLYNQDRRALYERWREPGDIRRFKNIRDINASPMSSRFVQTEKNFILESIYVEYQLADGWVKKAGLGNFKVWASSRDLFEFSTIQVERGIDYPFARVIDAGLSFNF